MRTWKQGRIGKIIFNQGNFVFIKCLKYPMAHVYDAYDPNTQTLKGFRSAILVQISAFSHIDVIGQVALRKKDIQEVDIQDVIENGTMIPLDFEQIQKKYCDGV